MKTSPDEKTVIVFLSVSSCSVELGQAEFSIQQQPAGGKGVGRRFVCVHQKSGD